jgi:hypothetical protein
MLGLIIIGVLIAYLGLAAFSVRAAWRSAREAGLAARQRWKRAGLVALVFYLIPFWDWIPTVVAHQYYCETEAKFEVYKTIEQWINENADVAKTLRYDPRTRFIRNGDWERFPLNQRIASERKVAEEKFLAVTSESARIVDVTNNAVLATYTDFRTGYPSLGVGGAGAWKFWLKQYSCGEEGRSTSAQFNSYASAWTKVGSENK